MSFLGGLLSVATGVAGVVTGNPALIASGVSGLVSNIGSSTAQSQVNQGIDTATADITQASKDAAGVIDNGYEASRQAKLDALTKVGALTQEQLQTINSLVDQGQMSYVDNMIQSAENYANSMGDAGAAYRTALGQAGTAYGGAQTKAVGNYSQSVQDLANKLGVDYDTAAQVYAQGLGTSADQYTGDLTKAATDEAGGLNAGAADYATTRKKGLDAITSALTPYAQGSGTDALDQIHALLTADPSQLNPTQARARDELLRDSTARLSASSLRGAGRAGVATINDADADFRAKSYAENKADSEAAATQLAQMGQQASTTIGNAGNDYYTGIAGNTQSANATGLDKIQSAASTGATYGANARGTGLQAINSASNAGAQARSNAGTDAAAKTLATANDVNTTNLGLSKDAATNDMNIGQNVALNDNTDANSITGQVQKNTDTKVGAANTAYNQAGTIAQNEGTINSDAALGKASADAGAIIDPAVTAANAAVSKGQVAAQTTGAVTSSISDLVKAGLGAIKSGSGSSSSSGSNPIIYT